MRPSFILHVDSELRKRIGEKQYVCWLHEISAEKIESFPLQLFGLLTTDTYKECGLWECSCHPRRKLTDHDSNIPGSFFPSRKMTSSCLLTLNTTARVNPEVFRVPQAVRPSSLDKLRHFGDSHDVIRPGSGRRGSCHLHDLVARTQLSALESAALYLDVVWLG